MSFDSLIRSAVNIAKNVTSTLQVTVNHQAWIANAGLGAFSYATAVPYRVILERRNSVRRLPNGQEITQVATITFLQPVPPNGAADRQEPIDPRDKIILPDGYVGTPISGTNGYVIDPITNKPYLSQVSLA